MAHRLPMAGYERGWILQSPGELRGRPLRYLLTTILQEAHGPLTVQELVSLCDQQGVVFNGRASKIVSDALRWEIRWGRVMRIGRGIYRSSRMPRSTSYWIRRRVRDIRDYLAGLKAPLASRWASSSLSQAQAPVRRTDDQHVPLE